MVTSSVGLGAARTHYEQEEFSITVYSSVLVEFCIVSIYDTLIEILKTVRHLVSAYINFNNCYYYFLNHIKLSEGKRPWEGRESQSGGGWKALTQRRQRGWGWPQSQALPGQGTRFLGAPESLGRMQVTLVQAGTHSLTRSQIFQSVL